MSIPHTTTPNGGAFLWTETRNGPPLGYVAEKIRFSLEFMHSTYQTVEEQIPNDLPFPDCYNEKFKSMWPNYSPKRDGVQASCVMAFQDGIVAYLALNNLLAMANDSHLFLRLLKMPRDDFKKWLDAVDREGSVT